MGPRMSCEVRFLFNKSLIPLVAIEGSLPSVSSTVFLQFTRASIVALVTLDRLFYGIHTCALIMCSFK